MALKRALIAVAHPDDEVLGCGATIAELTREGCEVHIAILGEGATSRNSHRELSSDNVLGHEVRRLQTQARRASTILGSQDPFFYGLPDNRFDTIPLLDIIKIVENLIEEIQPEAVFTHHSTDLNIDHTLLNRAVVTATRPTAGSPVTDVYAFETLSSTEWSFQYNDTIFRPNVFVDVSHTLELKIQALLQYADEVRAFPHPRSPRAVEATAVRWGSVAGFSKAEAFQLIRSLRTNNLERQTVGETQ